MEARVDFERYPNAAKLARNIVLFPQGGISRRPGTRFVKEVKDSSDETRIIPFEFSEEDSYIIEAGDGYFRFFRRQGNITVDDTDASVTNGTFTSNITGWTSASTGTAAIAHDSTNGRLQLTGTSDGIAWAYQGITISAGNTAKEHVLKFRIAGYGGGKVGFQVGTSNNTSDVLSEVLLEAGEHSISFTPGATTFYIQFRNSNKDPVRNMFVDNVEFIDNAPLELVSPYASADLENLQHFQAADVVYLCNGDEVRKLERREHKTWSCVDVFFKDGPYDEINDGEDITLKQLLVNPLFENKLTGWTDASTTGDCLCRFNESGKYVELIKTAAGGAILRQQLTVVSGIKHVLNILMIGTGKDTTYSIGTSAAGTQYATGTQLPGWASYEFTTSSTTLYIDVRSDLSNSLGTASVGGLLLYSENAKLIEPSAVSGSAITLTALGFSPFKSTDVGRLIRLEWPGREPGYCVITAYASSTSVTAMVMRTLASTTPTPSWQFGSWGGDHGYPKAISFFDGRAVYGNTDEEPNGLWFSQSGDLENMQPDSWEEATLEAQDDDAINVKLRSNKINPIFWISGQRKLMVGTAGGEWVVGSAGSVVTPDDISAKQHSAVPCSKLKAIEVNQTTIFADRSKKELHDLGFSLQDDSFLATDLTILADHVFRSPIKEMAYQRNPYSIIWSRREDGRLVSLSYNKQHEVLGWSQSVIGGSFGSGDAVVESIAIIPGAEDSGQVYNSNERNEVWMIVKRTINGSTKRYIEFLEYYYDGPLREDYDTESEWKAAVRESQAEAFYVDCGLTYDGSPSDLITGLTHLEGETVKVLADGIVHPDVTVSSGQIDLDFEASKIHIGLAYKHKYESLKLAGAAEGGTGVNKVKIITQVGMILLDTYNFKMTTVDYDEDGRRLHDLYDIDFAREYFDPTDPIPLYTGELTPSTEGVYSRDSRIYAEGDEPLPFTLLGLAPQMEIRAT